MLLVWARGLVFARINGLQLIHSSWWGLRWGALFRREKKKRLYWRYFNEASLLMRIRNFYYLRSRKVIPEPTVEVLNSRELRGGAIYLFNTVMTDPDLFGPLQDHYKLISDELYHSLHKTKRATLSTYKAPVIGIHIRRGDFKLGSTLTPVDYFIKGINIIRQTVAEDWPVTIFTDAGRDEISELLSLPATEIAAEKADILDILLLSKSRVLMLSAGSTFSYWAAFLSEGFVIRPGNDWLGNIKKSKSPYFEMKWQYDEAGSASDLKDNLSRELLGNEYKK